MSEIDNSSFFKKVRYVDVGDISPSEAAMWVKRERDHARLRIYDPVDLPSPEKRYFFNVLDHADGKTKILSVPESVARKIIDLSEQVPKKPWWRRLLEWLGFLRPQEDFFGFDISVIRIDDRGYPRYEMERL